MSQVGRKAIASISWPGPEADKSELAICTIQKCALAVRQAKTLKTYGWLQRSADSLFFFGILILQERESHWLGTRHGVQWNIARNHPCVSRCSVEAVGAG